MSDILHRVGIAAPVDRVYDAISTLDGLSHWWVTGVSGSLRLGGVFHIRPEAGGFDMQVADFAMHRFIKWKCVSGTREWIGTEVTLQIDARSEQTFVLLSHTGWALAGETMQHASTKWATYLLSLKGWLERSEGRPFPYDVKIQIGD